MNRQDFERGYQYRPSYRPYRSPFRKVLGIAVSDWKFFGAALIGLAITIAICWAFLILGQ